MVRLTSYLVLKAKPERDVKRDETCKLLLPLFPGFILASSLVQFRVGAETAAEHCPRAPSSLSCMHLLRSGMLLQS